MASRTRRTAADTKASGELTPEQLRQLVDRVYALLQADLRLEKTRSPLRRARRRR